MSHQAFYITQIIYGAFQTIGICALPIILTIWNHKEQKRKEIEKKEERRRKDDAKKEERNRRNNEERKRLEKEYIKNMIFCVFPSLSYSERKKLSVEEYKDILIDLDQKLYLNLSNLTDDYTYLKKYILMCGGFLMKLPYTQESYFYYDLYHTICIVYIKRDIQKYIDQGYLDPDWELRFQAYHQYISDQMAIYTAHQE
ncbi:MAG: hypothetical protein ACRCV0_05650 [Brevinema sp.]